MQRLVKKIDQIFPLHNSSAPCEEGGVWCELSERHTNRFGCDERASSTLQTERAMSPRSCVYRREETDNLLPPCFCRRFVQPWSALPVRWTDCGKQCHLTDRQTDTDKWARKYRISSNTAGLYHITLNFWVVHSCVRSGVLTAVLLKIQVFLEVTLCCWVNISWRFERCCYLHHQGQSGDPLKRL